IDWLLGHEVGVGQRACLERHVREELEHGLREQEDLLLLDDHGDQVPARSDLEVERALTRLADGVGRDPIDGPQLHPSYPRSFGARRRPPPSFEASHGGTGCAPNRSSPPVSFTSTTRRFARCITTTDTDAVSTTIRWKSSRGVPSRCASTMRTMSPCVAIATRPRGCRRAIVSTAATARRLASTNPSPPG